MSRFVRFFFFVAAFTVLAAVAACGRSDLGLYTWGDGGPDAKVDANPDAGGCNAATCPTGCCDPSGTCRTGTELNACGFAGAACTDCQKDGFDFCDGQAHACGTVGPKCDLSTCPQGCCTTFNGQPACLSGQSSLACGNSGQKCVDCTQSGELCDPSAKTCKQAPCGPNNCKGCCAGSTCVNAESDKQCGIGGLSCTDCTAQKAFCDQTSGQCVNVQPLCNATNCKGCCAGDLCITSQSDTQCGLGGITCTDCAQQGGTCQNGTCGTTCTAQNCPGCCQAGTCFAGFVDSRCGSGGATCVDCTAQASVCDTLVTPRTCKSQSTCPQPYGSCPSSVSTPVLPVTKGMCSATDLQDAQAACSTGFGSSACQSYFATLPQIDATCAKCLAPFDYALQDGVGIFNCVSPYVGSTCNHDTGCVTDCETQSCSQCPQSAVQQCDQQVLQGQCQTYLFQSQCVGQALFGPASFCSPQQYQGNYGSWLAAVGAHYCQ